MADEPSEHDEDVARQEIEAIKGMRLVDKTKRTYESKNKLFKAFLGEKYPIMMTPSGDIDLELLTIEEFQMFIMKKQREERLSFSACSVLFIL